MRSAVAALLCAVGFTFSVTVVHANVTTRDDAPQRYVVKKGDTLWGISKQFLNQPGQWPKLWGFNNDQIKNPHDIYPGQTLVLSQTASGPRLSIQNNTDDSGLPVIKISPNTYDVTNGYAIPTLPISLFQSFMKHPKIVTRQETDKAPKLVAGPDKRLIYSIGDRIYAKGVENPGRYLIYRTGRAIYDPEKTGKTVLADEVVYVGEAKTLNPIKGTHRIERDEKDAKYLNKDERFTEKHPLIKVPTTVATPLIITQIASEIFPGDHLFPVNENSYERFNFMPHTPLTNVRARIIQILDGVGEAGQYQTVILNKGQKDGLERGAVLTIYNHHKQKTWFDSPKGDTRQKMKYLSIPLEEIAHAMVYQVGDNISFAIIMDSVSNISIGSLAANEGLDLTEIDTK